MLEEFRDVYGMRFVGLEDPGRNAYFDYRVPDPEAPYPQDIIIDQNGFIRYWSWEYDPQELITIIDGLLAVTGVDDPLPVPGPARVGLRLTARPNPFLAGTEIQFDLAGRAALRLPVHDVGGRRVRILIDGGRAAGAHTIGWDGRDQAGRVVAGGVYFIELSAGAERASRRVVVVR